jgi:TonB-linked SusC/RagA family outer membrane protein
MKLKQLTSTYSPPARWLMTLGLALLLAGGAFAQRQISGTITDASTQEPLIGASLLVRGTTTGTITDIDGRFTLQVNDGDVLLVSYTGYEPQQVTVPVGVNTLNIALSAGVVIDEVVVTGYTAQQKRDLTGAVSTVRPGELLQIPSNNLTNQLQGRAAGVVVSGDGRPGQPAKVRIRGFTSLSGQNDPLYIVDGVPTQDVSSLNPNDIESLSVLKDAGAASIYGSRAANGVILITTKRGVSQGVRVNYDMYVGTQDPGRGPTNLLNTQEYADLQWLVYRNDGTNETHPIYGPSTNPRPTLPPWAADTDWWDVLTRNALITNHDISLSGGNPNANFYAGLNYFHQDGIVINNFSKRVAARLNSEFRVANGRVTFGENMTVTGRTGLQVAGTGSEGSPITRVYGSQPIIPAIVTQPIQGVSRVFQPGDFGGTGIAPRLGNFPNILADLTRAGDNRANDVRFLGSTFLDVKILEGLHARTTFGGTFQTGYNTGWTGATYERAENVATPAYNENSFVSSDWVWTNTLTFDRSFGASKLLAVAGYEAVKFGIFRNVSATRAGYFSDAFSFRTVSNGAQITAANSAFGTPTTLASSFLRADYSFNNTYYLSATVRRDGSSRFGPDFRYGIFPSVSAGVRVSDFISGLDFLSDLKIRGGYGTMGNQLPVSPVNQFFLFGGGPANSFYDIGGTGNSSVQGFRPTRIGNPDTKWETQITTNVGFDAALFNSALQISFDWYNKSAQDLLVEVRQPGIFGAAAVPALNIGDMRNSGIDLQIDYRQRVTSDLSLDATVTFTTYRNEILRLSEGVDFFDFGGSRIGPFNRNQVGQALGQFFGYQVLGLFQNQAEVEAAPRQDGAEPGFFRYADIDGNGVINPLDRTFIGDPNPDFTYGLNLGVNWKNLDLTAFFFGSQGNEIFNYLRWWTDFWPSFQNQKSTDLLYNSWTPERPNATTPKASNKSNFSNNTQSVSYYVENGSFLRLRNLQLGYTLPQTIAGRVGLSRARIYLQGVNLFTITKYSGLDPDLNIGDDRAFGIDLGQYPLVKQYIVGLNIGF